MAYTANNEHPDGVYGEDMRSLILDDGTVLPFKVYESGAGFYIGTWLEGEPFTRESERYWRTPEEAQKALDTGRWLPKI